MSPALLEQLLFKGVDGYSVAARGRDEDQCHGENFTYGEITPEVARDMLQLVDAKPGEAFYDLGAGTGKGVLYAAALSPIGKAFGIELVHALYDAACGALGRYVEHVRPELPDEDRVKQVGFINGDMLLQDFSDADIIYTHCTCFNSDLMTGLERKFEQLKGGSRILTVSKGLESPQFSLQCSELVQMGWGAATLYFYTRN